MTRKSFNSMAGSLVSVMLAIAATPALGQLVNFKTYNTGSGFPSRRTWSIGQDAQGYMYFGTLDGLVRFDGERFDVFHEGQGLPGTPVLAIEPFQDDVWVATPLGTGRLSANRIEPVLGWNRSFFRVLARTGPNTIWAGSEDGLFRRHWKGDQVFFDGRDIRALHTPDGQLFVGMNNGDVLLSQSPNSEPDFSKVGDALTTVRGFETIDGTTYISSNRGLFVFENGVFRQVTPAPDVQFASMVADNFGQLWIGTWGSGIVGFNPKTRAWLSIDADRALSSPYITATYRDYEGSLWFCMRDGGVLKHSQPEFVSIDLPRPSIVNLLTIDSQQRLWFFGPDLGLCRLRDAGADVEFITPINKDAPVFYLFADRSDRIWLVTQDYVACWNGRDLVDIPFADDRHGSYRWCFEDRSGRMWFGGSRGLGVLQDGAIEDVTPENDRSGRFWHSAELSPGVNVFTSSSSIWRYESETFEEIPYPDQIRSEPLDLLIGEQQQILVATKRGLARRETDGSWTSLITGEPITALFRSETGTLWAAGRDKIMSITPDGVVTPFNPTTQGGFIEAVFEDDDGGMWFIAHNRLLRFDGQAWTEMSLQQDFDDRSVLTATRSASGTVWFGTTRGLMAYRPDHRLKDVPPPRVAIRGLTLGDQPQPLDQELAFDYGHGPIQVEFAALSFINDRANSLRIELDGPSASSEITSDTSKEFMNLWPGDYQLRVWARNAHDQESKTPATLSFRIRRPYWMALWFHAMLGASIIILAIVVARVFSRLRTKRLLEWNQALETQLEEKTKTLVETKELEATHALMVTLTHEINQPLTALQGSIDLIKLNNPPGKRDPKTAVNHLQGSVDAIQRILKRLRDLEHVKYADYSPGIKMIDLNPSASKSILFVDDDQILLDIWASYFQEQGYRVHTAGDGKEALELFTQYASEIGLVVSDNNMPGLSGYELYRAIREQSQQVPYYIFTGYDCEPELRQELNNELDGIIRKPIKLGDLMRVIERHVKSGD